MLRKTATLAIACLAVATCSPGARAADFVFFGRSGDAIELDFGSLPGVPAGATFSGLQVGGFGDSQVALTSDDLAQGAFASDGRVWVCPDPTRDTPAAGDTDPTSRGFQGAITGSLFINGETKSFRVVVQPGYTGAGEGSVGQSFERVGRAANNPLYVAQQQQRLRYFGFRAEGGDRVAVTGVFDSNTDDALQTFQAAFDGGLNATQANSGQADGIVGPTSAAWLNAANAPTWDELIDPDPQTPGTFSVSSMIGDFDILPSSDPGGGGRTGNTPQVERFGTSWAIDLFTQGAAGAKAATGVTQLMNGMSTEDGYGSGAYHSTHLVGMDIDLHTDYSTWNNGNGVVSAAEQSVIDQALAYVNSDSPIGVARILTSNQDILNGVNSAAPGVAVWDSSGGHQNHLHVDVRVPDRITGLANLAGDFNLDGSVDAADYVVWRNGMGATFDESDLAVWKAAYAAASSPNFVAVPEPSTAVLAGLAAIALRLASSGLR